MRKAKSPKIGVIGVGMVGIPLKRYFEEKRGYARGRDLFLYDTDSRKGYNDDPNQAEIIFIAVPSPSRADGSVEVNPVISALARLKSRKTAVIKSTVPPGTTERLQKRFPYLKILFNPEFLTEKNAWNDFLKPDRQIVGFTRKSRAVASKVLALLPAPPFSALSRKYKLTATEAELVKYAANVYLARRVVFANVIADVAAKLGVDYENVRCGLATDKRIGDSHLDVYCHGYRGFGGYCFPKDTQAFLATCNSLGLHECVDLIEADWKFNEQLLRRQGLSVEDVSRHDRELGKKLKPVKRKGIAPRTSF